MDLIAGVVQRQRVRKTTVAIIAAIVSFLAYSSVYAYRKPFTVAEFDGLKYWGITYQTLLIISQVIGYMLSKMAGIKFISELKLSGRFKAAVVLVGTGWACLLIFAIVPAPYGMLLLFINGFVLGFLWGIVFSYVEGRTTTDFIGAVLAVSFIFAGGFTRSVAKWLIVEWGVTEYWMPFMTGLIFALPLLCFLSILEKLPPPDDEDNRERRIRVPMDWQGRKKLLKNFGTGLYVCSVSYLFLTIMRDIRDNYMSNIWTELGYGNNYSIFARTETITSLSVLLVMALTVMIRKNIRALLLLHVIIATGLLIAGLSSILFITGHLSGMVWMQLVSLGLYMGYIPFNSIFFERLIASFRIAGNVGFLIYFADAFGYLGSVLVMLGKEFYPMQISWSGFYSKGVIGAALIGLTAIAFSYSYFQKKYRWQNGQQLL